MNQSAFFKFVGIVSPLIAANDTDTLTEMRDFILEAVPLPVVTEAGPAPEVIRVGNALPDVTVTTKDPAYDPRNIFK